MFASLRANADVIYGACIWLFLGLLMAADKPWQVVACVIALATDLLLLAQAVK